MEHDAIQQQMDEFSCVLSMFPEKDELRYEIELKDQYEGYLSIVRTAAATPPSSRFEFSILFKQFAVDGTVPELEVTYPPAYPIEAHVNFVVRCPWLPRSVMEQLQTELACIATGNDGEMVTLQLYQCMADTLEIAIAQRAPTQQSNHNDSAAMSSLSLESTPEPPTPAVVGRRAIYFHHIIASSKRRVLKEWARELALGGFSKIGWPGVVIVEGDERDAQEYVRRLQHLRWKQMVVRGEQTEPVSTGRSLDAMRLLPRAFCEFPETAMSEAAALCRDAGLERLFLTVMKIYRDDASNGNE